MKFRSFWAPTALACFLLAGCDGGDPELDAGPEIDGDVTSPCPGGLDQCDDSCVDFSSDRANCGACDNACAAGEACVDGACGVVCPGGQTACSGACADTSTSRAHCGACGNACGAGESCVDGSCEIACPADHTVCGSVCADTASNPDHCGGCDSACAAGEVCSEGVCAASCGAGLTDCGGACVDTANSPSHCGGCGTACDMPASTTAICVAGSCDAICAPLTGDCNGDLTDGCETALDTNPESCGACNRVCELANADGVGCASGGCVVTTCVAGFEDCDGVDANGCEAELASDSANCGACGTACGAGEVCNSSTCIPAYGEDCSDAFALSPGTNTILYTASTADYLTSSPSCTTYSLDGPDVVMSYTATVDERVTLDFTKPDDTRWAAVVSTAGCGTLSPSAACMSEYSGESMTGSFVIGAGETAYVYLRDTTSGDNPLDNPLTVDVTSAPCSDAAPIVSLEPANATTSDSVLPAFVVTFGAPVISSLGTVTLTGATTSRSYDLSTSPSQVSFSSGNTVMTIQPETALPPGETITVSWSGLQSVTCTTPVAVPAPTWEVTMFTPPCIPGVDGVVGTTTTRFAGPPSSFEYYVAADEDPTGWVYVGSTSELYRMPKAGGASQDVEALAGLTSSNLGYNMLIDGSNIYTLEYDFGGASSDQLYRISSDGGATWVVEDYASFSPATIDAIQGITSYGGRIYLVTHTPDSDDTEVWSVDAAAATLPAAATLEFTFTGEGYCDAVVRDDTYFYMGCADNDTLIRIPVAGGALEVLSDRYNLTSTATALHGEDLDADGTLDVLYLQTFYEEIYYVCDPASATPYTDPHTILGTDSGNYGMGLDRTGNTLWFFDDDTDEFISIQ